MKLYFHSPNEFPLDAVSIVGLSAKLDPNSIGTFGTGLKYAISVILRIGGSIELLRDDERYTFRTESARLRETDYERVVMDGPNGSTVLPFTLNYGKEWKPWQAYRELFSNCLDEKGGVSLSPVKARTVFIVEGLEECFSNHDAIFLNMKEKPVLSGPWGEVYAKHSPHIFFRGIRAAPNNEFEGCTLNIVSGSHLTEDRTITDIWGFRFHFTRWASEQATKPELKALFRLKAIWPVMLSIDKLSPVAVEVCEEETQMPLPFAFALAKHKKARTTYTPHPLSAWENAQIERAVDFVQQLEPQLRLEHVVVSAGLNDMRGCYLPSTGEIFVSYSEISEGQSSLRATIFEEAMHKFHGYKDESRDFQDFLLRKLINYAERAL